MPYQPLTPNPATLTPAPTAVPALRLPKGTALHGNTSCSAVPAAKNPVAVTIPVTGGTLTQPVHCRGNSPEWQQLDNHTQTLYTYDNVNELAQATWNGNTRAFTKLLRDADDHHDPDIRGYAAATTRDAIAENAITEQALLADMLKTTIAYMSFTAQYDHGEAAEVLGQRGFVHLQEHMKSSYHFESEKQLARAWCTDPDSALTGAGQSIAWASRDTVDRGFGAGLGDLATADPDTIARLLNEGLTGYLADTTSGTPVTVHMPTGTYHIDTSTYARLYGRAAGDTLTLTIPLAAVALLVRTRTIDVTDVHVEDNGRTLTPKQLHAAVTAIKDADWKNLNRLREHADQVHHVDRAARAATESAATAAALDRIVDGASEEITEEHAVTFTRYLAAYATGHASIAAQTHLDQQLAGVPAPLRRTYAHAVIERASSHRDVLHAVAGIDPTVVTAVFAALARDRVIAADPHVLTRLAATAVLEHGNDAGTWAATVTTTTKVVMPAKPAPDRTAPHTDRADRADPRTP